MASSWLLFTLQMDEDFIQEFKKSYYQNGKYDITSQVPYLSKLADSYKQKYEADGDWKDCLKVCRFTFNDYASGCLEFRDI